MVPLQYNYDESGYPAAFDFALIKVEQNISHANPSRKTHLELCASSDFPHGRFIGLGLTNQNPDEPADQLMHIRLKKLKRYYIISLFHTLNKLISSFRYKITEGTNCTKSFAFIITVEINISLETTRK